MACGEGGTFQIRTLMQIICEPDKHGGLSTGRGRSLDTDEPILPSLKGVSLDEEEPQSIISHTTSRASDVAKKFLDDGGYIRRILLVNAQLSAWRGRGLHHRQGAKRLHLR